MTKVMMVLALLTGLCARVYADGPVTGQVLSKTSQASSFTTNFDVGDFKSLSMQVTLATHQPSNVAVSAGSISSATFQVVDYTGLRFRASSATITLPDGMNTNAHVSAITVNILGHPFVGGTDWKFSSVSSTVTMQNLTNAINASSLATNYFTATVSSNVVTVTAKTKGSFANSWIITTSTTSDICTLTTFSTGQDAGFVTINGVTLRESTDFNAVTSNAQTAMNVVTAINANSSLSAIVGASTQTSNAGFFRVQSKDYGVNQYNLTVSNPSYLLNEVAYFEGGATKGINTVTGTLTSVGHGLTTGMAVLYSTTSNQALGGLTDEATYYAYAVDSDNFQLASSAANAVAHTTITFTSLLEHDTFTMKPLAFVAKVNTGVKWYGSNDNVTYADLTGSTFAGVSLSSKTYSADGATLWDFGAFDYRYLQIQYAPTDQGGMNITATINGRK